VYFEIHEAKLQQKQSHLFLWEKSGIALITSCVDFLSQVHTAWGIWECLQTPSFISTSR